MYKAIIIDDEKWVISDIRETFRFEQNGFEVTGVYTNADDALEAIAASPPDLIVSDICMERTSGLDMARILHEKQFAGITVLVSGYEKFAYCQEALRLGVFDYLIKPLDDDAVASLMQRVIEKLDSIAPRRKDAAQTSDVLSRAISYIEENYSQSISLESLADSLYVNMNYLSELFSKRMGITFTQYKNQVRIEHAKDMLTTSGASMTSIAMQCGFNSASRFSKVFHQFTGVSPLEYQNTRGSGGR